jgi:uncharacterized repeat protein (TIGR01451 family)
MINKLVKTITIVMAIMLCGPGSGWSDASQKIRLTASAQVEVESVNEAGRRVKRRVPAEKVVPGTEIIYTIAYHNPADQNAEQVVITNPIPEQMRYRNQSAFGEKALVTFSVDNGQSFDLPKNLYVTDATGRRFAAQPEDYTHIRWKLQDPIPPQASGQVGYRAILQ